MNGDIQEEIDKLRGLCIVHAAEVEALFLLITSLYSRLNLSIREKEDICDTYVRMRRDAGQRLLIQIENSNPKLAAQIQALLDDTCKQFPF